MKPWVTLAKSGALTLQEHDGEYVIRVNGQELMSSRRNRSEIEMAKWARGRTLIGGLGLGYTLKAVIEHGASEIVVAELEPAVVEWNRTFIKTPALDDPRVVVHVGDVATAPGKYDSILLDTDNGPVALTDPRNAKLYGPAGIAQFKRMLKPKGVFVVWSAKNEQAFVKRLGQGGFEIETVTSAGHVLFVARVRA